MKIRSIQRQSRRIPAWVILAIIIVVGTGFRTYNLSQVITWYDEALTLFHVSGQDLGNPPFCFDCGWGPVTFKSMQDEFLFRDCSRKNVVRSVLRTHPEHAAGFYVAVHQWKKIVKNDVTLLRLLPVLFGVLVLPAFYWFSYELLRSKGTSLLCALVLALSPLQIVQSQELREYSLYELCFALSCASFLYAWRKNTAFSWILYGCISVVGYNCTYWLFIITSTQLIYSTIATVLRSRKKHPSFRPHLIKWAAHVATASLAVIAVAEQIAQRLLRHEHALEMVKWVHLPPVDNNVLLHAWLFSRLFDWMYSPDPFFTQKFEYVLFVILLIELCAIFYLARRARPQFAFLLVILLSYVSILDLQDAVRGGHRSIVVRYFLPSIMIAVIPVCYMVWHCWRSKILSRRLLAVAAIGLLSVCQLWSDYALQSWHEHQIFIQKIKPVANFLNRNENLLVITDSKHVNFFLVLATSCLLDNPSRKFAWFFEKLPDWFYTVDKACVIYARPGVEERYEAAGFNAVRYSNGVVLLTSKKVHKPFYTEDKDELERLKLKKKRKLRARPWWIKLGDRWLGR